VDYDINIEQIYVAYRTRRYSQWEHKGKMFSIKVPDENSLLYHLEYIEKGSVQTVNHGEEHILSPGWVMLSREGEKEFEIKSIKRPTEHISITFITDKPISILNASRGTAYYDFTGDEEIRNAFLRAEELYENRCFMNRADIKICIMEILGRVFERVSEFGMLPTAISNSLSYIWCMAFEENINIRKLAEDNGLSYEYFIRLFKQHMSCSPKQYINRRRLERVKMLLSRTDYSVAEAGLLSGFADVSYLNEVFRKEYGITPRQFRAKYDDNRGDLCLQYKEFKVEQIFCIIKVPKHNTWKRNFLKDERNNGGKLHFSLLTRGSVMVKEECGEESVIMPGTVIVTKGSSTSYSNESIETPTEFITVVCYCDMHSRIMETLGRRVLWVPENKAEIMGIFKNAYELYEKDSRVNIMKIKAAVMKIINSFVKECVNDERPEAEKLYNALNYMEQMAYEENISIRKLAEDTGLSYEYFIRLFKKHFGCSPKQYINSLRIKRAELLLRVLDEPISVVGRLSGIFDSSYFNEAFKQEFGVTPYQYRKRLRSMEK